MNDLAIIIVNYRTAMLTLGCLASLATEILSLPATQVCVVDNASGDGSEEIIAREIARGGWSSWATLVRADRNGGFAAGNNTGIRALGELPRYVLLLNPDTVVRPQGISSLVQFADSRPHAGIVGSLLENRDGSPQCGAFRFPSLLGELEAGFRWGVLSKMLRKWTIPQPIPVRATLTDWVAGTSFLVRREVLQQVGTLDERFFMYYEEVDLCRRANAAGWECWCIPDSRVVHLEGQSSGVGARDRRPLPRYVYDSRRYYYMKNHGRMYAMMAELIYQFGYVTWRLRRSIQGKSDHDPSRRIYDGWRYVILPALAGGL